MPRAVNPDITRFILANVEARPDDIGPLTAKRFGVTRATASNYLRRLTEEGLLSARGATRARSYSLKHLLHIRGMARIEPGAEDDLIWRREIRPRLDDLPETVLGVCQYGFTALVSNALDHSGGSTIAWWMRRDAGSVELGLSDDGAGVFETVRRGFGLEDDRRALLELAKGGVTTDPDRHVGRGLQLTARLFDRFSLAAGRLSHQRDSQGRHLVRRLDAPMGGTTIVLRADIATTRTLASVMARQGPGGGGEVREIPVALASFDGEALVSRSQARRLMSRLEDAGRVVLDFAGVEVIGQDFAHEIFRVFRAAHPATAVTTANAAPAVRGVIARA